MPEQSAHWEKSPPELVERFASVLERFPDLEQRKMFGYPAAFTRGHMVTGLHGQTWVVRLGADELEELRHAGGATFEPMPGRPMKGFLSLPEDIISDDEQVGDWVGRAQTHVLTLPRKQAKARKTKAR